MSDWRHRAACRDVPLEQVDAFFADLPEYAEGLAAARAICGACSVREACLAEALDKRYTAGIYGGLTTAERAGLAARA
jgi:WhiB family redox-sensing transcriptional regulator